MEDLINRESITKHISEILADMLISGFRREAVSFDELNHRIQKALKDEPTAYDIDTVIKELSEAMGTGNSAFMKGYRAALEDVKSYGKPVEHVIEHDYDEQFADNRDENGFSDYWEEN